MVLGLIHRGDRVEGQETGTHGPDFRGFVDELDGLLIHANERGNLFAAKYGIPRL